MTISRFKKLFDTTAYPDPIEWPDLFREFSTIAPFLGGSSHPGWSAAEFDPPKRDLANVRKIHALVLDYDNKTKDGDRVTDPVTIAQISEAFADFYGLIHTSRNHTADWPRFRVILPLTRSISKFEYQALWQHAARFAPGLDPSPKDASRFWYTPGVGDHEGACFEAVTLTGAFMEPDDWLNRPLPVPPSIVLANSAAADPNREARARAYIQRMPEAVSGAGGHTALWNVTRKLVCDFELDEQSAYRLLVTEYNPRCQPPWGERELRHKVKDALTKARVRVPVADRPRQQIPQERHQEPLINRDTNEPATAADDDESWRKALRYKQDGSLTKDVGNAALILKNAKGWKGTLMFDSMAFRTIWFLEPEYYVGLEPPRAGSTLEDHHIVYVQQVLAKYFGLSIGKDIAWSAVEAAAHESEVHPVQEYLSSLEWDGKRRLPTWLHSYLGAPDTDYVAAVGRWWLISAVARAFRPGCQADHVLILEGKQGKGKSQAIRALGDPWYLGSMPDIRDRDRAADTIGGYWLVEIAELDALKGSASTRIKEFVSQQNDVYRKAYGRATLSRPRSCVFVGTTNESSYLSDPTGARRFWPVRCEGTFRREELSQDRDQLWAEAVIAYRSGEQWHPHDEYVQLIGGEQSERYAEDDWTSVIQQWIRSSRADDFTSAEILGQALSIEPRFWDRSAQTRVGAILTKLGYEKHRPRGSDGLREYRYHLVQPQVVQVGQTQPSEFINE